MFSIKLTISIDDSADFGEFRITFYGHFMSHIAYQQVRGIQDEAAKKEGMDKYFGV
jgi:hypothetical protein